MVNVVVGRLMLLDEDPASAGETCKLFPSAPMMDAGTGTVRDPEVRVASPNRRVLSAGLSFTDEGGGGGAVGADEGGGAVGAGDSPWTVGDIPRTVGGECGSGGVFGRVVSGVVVLSRGEIPIRGGSGPLDVLDVPLVAGGTTGNELVERVSVRIFVAGGAVSVLGDGPPLRMVGLLSCEPAATNSVCRIGEDGALSEIIRGVPSMTREMGRFFPEDRSSWLLLAEESSNAASRSGE